MPHDQDIAAAPGPAPPPPAAGIDHPGVKFPRYFKFATCRLHFPISQFTSLRFSIISSGLVACLKNHQFLDLDHPGPYFRDLDTLFETHISLFNPL